MFLRNALWQAFEVAGSKRRNVRSRAVVFMVVHFVQWVCGVLIVPILYRAPAEPRYLLSSDQPILYISCKGH